MEPTTVTLYILLLLTLNQDGDPAGPPHYYTIDGKKPVIFKSIDECKEVGMAMDKQKAPLAKGPYAFVCAPFGFEV
jgi:hypothetical protein